MNVGCGGEQRIDHGQWVWYVQSTPGVSDFTRYWQNPLFVGIN